MTTFFNGEPSENEELGSKSPTLLIIDQFEKIFTSYSERWEDREDFFHQVVAALDEHAHLHILFTMREDFIAV